MALLLLGTTCQSVKSNEISDADDQSELADFNTGSFSLNFKSILSSPAPPLFLQEKGQLRGTPLGRKPLSAFVG